MGGRLHALYPLICAKGICCLSPVGPSLGWRLDTPTRPLLGRVHGWWEDRHKHPADHTLVTSRRPPGNASGLRVGILMRSVASGEGGGQGTSRSLGFVQGWCEDAAKRRRHRKPGACEERTLQGGDGWTLTAVAGSRGRASSPRGQETHGGLREGQEQGSIGRSPCLPCRGEGSRFRAHPASARSFLRASHKL